MICCLACVKDCAYEEIQSFLGESIKDLEQTHGIYRLAVLGIRNIVESFKARRTTQVSMTQVEGDRLPT
jgi:hypothetical protein